MAPGANDDAASLDGLAAFVAENPLMRGVELLPRHALGAHEYAALGLAPPPLEQPEPELWRRMSSRSPPASSVASWRAWDDDDGWRRQPRRRPPRLSSPAATAAT